MKELSAAAKRLVAMCATEKATLAKKPESDPATRLPCCRGERQHLCRGREVVRVYLPRLGLIIPLNDVPPEVLASGEPMTVVAP